MEKPLNEFEKLSLRRSHRVRELEKMLNTISLAPKKSPIEGMILNEACFQIRLALNNLTQFYSAVVLN